VYVAEGYSRELRDLLRSRQQLIKSSTCLQNHLREKAIGELQKQKRALDDVIDGYQNKDIELLKSVPGVGEVASKTYYAAISTIKRFKRAKQLTSYCGLVPMFIAAECVPIMAIKPAKDEAK
jgi:hypothetical protein